ncbi:TonB-dependent receptor, partial [Desulfovibrio desulfuricans]
DDPTLAGTERPHTPYQYKTDSYLVSFFGRANYILMNRYYLTATVRDDGTSRFKDHWAWFPSVALAWKAKEENFLKDISWISDLKLRLGWGMTGQQAGEKIN